MCAKTHLNTYAVLSSVDRDLTFGSSLYHHTYVVYASSKGYGGSVHLPRLALSFADRRCDKYQFLHCFLFFTLIGYFLITDSFHPLLSVKDEDRQVLGARYGGSEVTSDIQRISSTRLHEQVTGVVPRIKDEDIDDRL